MAAAEGLIIRKAEGVPDPRLGRPPPLTALQAHTHVVESYDAFKAQIEEGGFVLMHWDGTAETEARVKDETKATIRCVPFPDQFPGVDTEAPGTDPVSGRPSERLVVYARAY